MKTFTKFLASLVLAVVMLPAVASAQLTVSQGGTGLTSVSANNILYGVSSSLRLGSEAAFTYNPSTNLFTTTYASTTGLSATNGDLSKLTVTYASSTGFTATNATIGTATGTNLYGFGLPGAGCNGAGQAVTWASGLFGCGTITAAGDGISNWLYNGSRLTPSTTVGIGVFASSTIGGGTGATGLTVAGTATSTDLVVRNLTSALTLTDGQGFFAEYAGTTCTNQFVRVLSALGVATCATVDISADTNLTADGTEIVLTGDALSLGTALTFTTGTSSTSFQTALLGVGTDYISDITGTGIINTAGSLQASLGTSISAAEMADGDNGFFTYTTGVAAVDANAWTSANLASYLSDETGTAGNVVFSTNPLLAGFRSNASSTIGGGTGATGLTVAGTATTTNLKITSLTASRLIATAADKLISSVSTLTSWIAGTSNEITVTDDGDGSVTLSLPATVDLGNKTSFETVNGTAPTVDTTGEIAVDTTSDQFVYYGASSKKVLGNGNIYPAFTYATSTAWTGTTTIPLGTAFVAETWNAVQCFTDTGTLNVSFTDGTNRMNPINASTTVGTVTLSTNNTFTAAEKRYVEVGTPASSPTKISCTVSKSLTAD